MPWNGVGIGKDTRLIGRNPIKAGRLLALSVLIAGLFSAGTLTRPISALADSGLVGYRAPVLVTIVTGRDKRVVTSTAYDVGALLEEQGIRLGRYDVVEPSLADELPSGGTVRITRVVTWDRVVNRAIPPKVIRRIDFDMAPGSIRVLADGATGERAVTLRYAQTGNGKARATVLASRIVRSSHPRVIAEGIDEYQAFERFAQRGVDRTVALASSAMQMTATAYTADCAGCSGITASGRPAGHGIVAVDPSVIPLGTRLYIPGYGYAVAGDTGGAIRGDRIDLGFNSERDALLFGRREVTVYRVK